MGDPSDPNNALNLSFPQMQQPTITRQNLHLHMFWQRQLQEIEEMEDFKSHHLPLARIKKIMKSDEDVRPLMISAEAPVLFAKACEMFILELTLRAWIHTEENKRRTLQRNDIAMAISKTDSFDFLIDIVPREDLKPDDMTRAMTPEQLYYLTQQPQALLSVNMGDQGRGVVDPSLLLYQQQLMQFGLHNAGLGGLPSGGNANPSSMHGGLHDVHDSNNNIDSSSSSSSHHSSRVMSLQDGSNQQLNNNQNQF
eukprot:TRINITY_DN6384_c0_g1_i1.p1 TRINITY_DN6384_c0_g1~~TRINITY_DN6384_c0_g1_i1.p1  ORF type:complete len:253 (-),score=60.39 TRINITY_DN6384_c0_g1_i1:71-829(-)